MTEVKKQIDQKLFYDPEGLRMATPVEIAEYKAERLATNTIIDAGCGIGIQSIYFSKYSKMVIAIERDKERYEMAKKNASVYGRKNIEFINGDALDRSVLEKINESNIVHSDPSRKKKGENWSMDMLSPSPKAILKSYGADAFSFDLPVHINHDIIPNEWEKEFISVRGEPKRVSVYIGDIRKFNTSAITLPSKERITKSESCDRNFFLANKPGSFIFEIDQIINLSGLLPEFLSKFPDFEAMIIDSQRLFLTSDVLKEDNFIINSYEVLEQDSTVSGIKKKIAGYDIGKIILRFNISDNLYYSAKKIIEDGIKGNGTGYLFKHEDFYYLAKKITKD